MSVVVKDEKKSQRFGKQKSFEICPKVKETHFKIRSDILVFLF
jgi:hypothetical protein